MSERHATDRHDPCTGACTDLGADQDRRGFLRDGLLAVAALTTIAGDAVPLEAMARRLTTGLAVGATVTYDIPATDGATIDRTHRVILIRHQGMIYAADLECPHKGTMVQWQPAEQRFFCPKHKSTFRPEGTRIQGKSPRWAHPVASPSTGCAVSTTTFPPSRRTA